MLITAIDEGVLNIKELRDNIDNPYAELIRYRLVDTDYVIVYN